MYLNPYAVVVSPSDEATNARLEYGNTLQLTMVCVAEQKSAAVSLKLHKNYISISFGILYLKTKQELIGDNSNFTQTGYATTRD